MRIDWINWIASLAKWLLQDSFSLYLATSVSEQFDSYHISPERLETATQFAEPREDASLLWRQDSKFILEPGCCIKIKKVYFGYTDLAVLFF